MSAGKPPFVKECSVASGWTLRWDRQTKVFEVKFFPSLIGDQERDALCLAEDGEVVTKREMEIRYLQSRLAEVARTGDLK